MYRAVENVLSFGCVALLYWRKAMS